MARISLVLGAAGTAAFMLYAGKRVGTPSMLMVLFTIWVVSPFALLALVHTAAKRWAEVTRATAYGVTPIVSAVCLVIYGVAALGASRPKTAIFVMVAPLSWLLIVIAITTAALIARRNEAV